MSMRGAYIEKKQRHAIIKVKRLHNSLNTKMGTHTVKKPFA